MFRFRLHTSIVIIVVLLLSACALPWVEQKAERGTAVPEQEEAGQREASTGVTSRQRQAVWNIPLAGFAVGPGIYSTRQAVWPQDVYPVDVITEHPTGLTFTVREMRIEEPRPELDEGEGLIIDWEATNRSDKALELKSKEGEPPLLQDNTGRIYEYENWPTGETLAVEPGEQVEGEWAFGLPAFDAYRLRLGVNLLHAAVGIGLPSSHASFWSDP